MAEGHDRESPVEYTILECWKREQLELKKKLLCEDCISWGESTDTPFSNLRLIGGVDLSFVKDDLTHACACLVVLSFPKLKVVYEDLTLVHVELPYIPEYLAFREVRFLVEAVSKLRRAKPDLLPQIILVDGNGMLHPRGFGIACHLGVLTDIPTVGVAKTLFHVDGIEKHAEEIKNCLKSSGDSIPLEGDSGTIWGMALRSTQQSHNPIYISVGHKTGLETAVRLAHACCQYRIPEPIRQADIRSREYLREHYPEESKTCSCRMKNDESDLLNSKEEDDPKKEGQDLVHETCQNFDQLNIS